ncbi:hypothetical protein LTR04_005242 [Oleoguttula sp. CCFEE 6159]|nr:hypothetical protein LTR04_005242 [Oleoguttula sp. CCFEE 6159]
MDSQNAGAVWSARRANTKREHRNYRPLQRRSLHAFIFTSFEQNDSNKANPEHHRSLSSPREDLCSALISPNRQRMAPTTINVLLTSFPGLSLPPTLSLPLLADSTISDFTQALSTRLPPNSHRLILTTTSNKQLSPTSTAPLASLLSSPNDAFLPLRLSAPLCGGKGGFGSQLRAAGGRMSSRKKRGEADTGSNRNLDGRRLRTVTEAKALAEYLALKPEMEKKEKEERRKRWEMVVQAAEEREEEVRSDRAGGGKGRLDGKWVEAKEEVELKTREAVVAAMRAAAATNGATNGDAMRTGSESSASDEGESDEAEASGSGSSEEEKPALAGNATDTASARTYFGWDEEDEDMSDDADEGEEGDDGVGKDGQTEPVLAIALSAAYVGKGKAKA